MSVSAKLTNHWFWHSCIIQCYQWSKGEEEEPHQTQYNEVQRWFTDWFLLHFQFQYSLILRSGANVDSQGSICQLSINGLQVDSLEIYVKVRVLQNMTAYSSMSKSISEEKMDYLCLRQPACSRRDNHRVINQCWSVIPHWTVKALSDPMVVQVVSPRAIYIRFEWWPQNQRAKSFKSHQPAIKIWTLQRSSVYCGKISTMCEWNGCGFSKNLPMC